MKTSPTNNPICVCSCSAVARQRTPSSLRPLVSLLARSRRLRVSSAYRHAQAVKCALSITLATCGVSKTPHMCVHPRFACTFTCTGSEALFEHH